MRAAYWALSSNLVGTITSASTVQSGTFNRFRRRATPGFRLAQRIFVSYDQRGFHFVAEAKQTVLRKAAQHETNIPLS